jgi:hypothetical protein
MDQSTTVDLKRENEKTEREMLMTKARRLKTKNWRRKMCH